MQSVTLVGIRVLVGEAAERLVPKTELLAVASIGQAAKQKLPKTST